MRKIILFFLVITNTSIATYTFGQPPAAAPAVAHAAAVAVPPPPIATDTFNQASEFKLSSREFTDFTGFQSDNPTGIIQQEFIGTVSRGMGRKSLNKPYLFKGISANILFNRIDKSNNSLNYPVGALLANGGTNPYVAPFMTTMDIFKYSNTQFGISVPVVFIKPSENSTLSLNYIFSVIRNKPYYSDSIKFGIDSGNNSSNLRPTYSFANKVELEYQTTFKGDATSSFGISAKLGLMYISLKDSYYKQYDAAAIDPYNKITALASTASTIGGSQPIIYGSVCLEKLMGANQENSVFFRINYYFQSGKYNAAKSSNVTGGIPLFEERRFYNHFVQIQTGVTLDVGKLFGVGTPTTPTTTPPVAPAPAAPAGGSPAATPPPTPPATSGTIRNSLI